MRRDEDKDGMEAPVPGDGTSGASGPEGTGGDADTVVDPDPVDDANPETNGAG